MENDKPIVPAKGGLCGKCMPTRYAFAIFGCFGMAIVYGLKVNFHVAIIPMVNHTHNELSHKGKKADLSGICKFPKTQEKREDGPLKWNDMVQGILLSGYFIGYFFGQIPGGRCAEKYSAKWVFFASVAISVFCAVVTPVSSPVHWGIVLAIRILMGFAGGFSFPAMHALLAHWAPPQEVSFMSTVAYAGLPLGTLIFMLTAGIIAKYISWQAVYYIQGGASCIWMILWAILIEDTPFRQKFISEEERNFIAQSTKSSTTNVHSQGVAVPWKNILKSMPFYAIMVAHFCSNWGWYMLLMELPQYMKKVLSFTITEITTFTSIPYLTMWIFSMCLSRLLDYLRSKKKLSTTAVRKIATTLQAAIPGVCLGIICIFYCHRTLGVVLMTVAVTFYGAMFSGFLCNHLDISPNFAGTLMAITNTIATLPAIIVPNICGVLFHQYSTYWPWLLMFLMTIGLFVLELVVYNLFGSGETQAWNRGKVESTAT